jgi:AcrR family transcriptional regulator
MAGKAAGAKKPRLGREEWIEGARAVLIESGVANVRVEPLAAKLGVTTGSFYWHFQNRDALLAALLEDWVSTNTQSWIAAAADDGRTGEQQFAAIVELWVTERGFSSAYDSAVRDWARTSEEVTDAVRKIDRKRIASLRKIFANLGYDADRAEVRARIMYYHQVGHYTMGLRDSPPTHQKYRPLYIEALRDGIGRDGK